MSTGGEQESSQDDIDYGTGEGAAYGGSDADAPLFIPHGGESHAGANNHHKDKDAYSKYFRNVCEDAWSRTGWVWRKVFSSSSVWSAIAAVVIAVSTIVYTVYAHRQWKVLSGQLSEMRKANSVSESIAYAACISAQIARSTLLELQAGGVDSHNLAVGSITQAAAVTRAEAALLQMQEQSTMQWSVDSNSNIVFFIDKIRNGGKSDARNVSWKAEAAIYELGQEPDFRFTLPALNTEKTGNFPSEQVTPWQIKISDKNGKRMLTTDPDFRSLTTGHGYLAVYGRVTYQDIFGGSHWLQFCTHYMFPARDTTTRFPKCAAYNQTDLETLPGKSPAGTPSPVPPEISCPVPKSDEK